MSVTYLDDAMRAPHLSEEAFHDCRLNVNGALIEGMAEAMIADERRFVDLAPSRCVAAHETLMFEP